MIEVPPDSTSWTFLLIGGGMAGVPVGHVDVDLDDLDAGHPLHGLLDAASAPRPPGRVTITDIATGAKGGGASGEFKLACCGRNAA